MTDLINWLCAQLDEDERVAKAASPAPWRVVYYESGAPERTALEIEDREGGGIADNEHGAIPPGPEDAEHIARHDPARVLREVEAKQRIVGDCQERRSVQGDRLLRLLALPYADRPGYQEEWTPS